MGLATAVRKALGWDVTPAARSGYATQAVMLKTGILPPPAYVSDATRYATSDDVYAAVNLLADCATQVRLEVYERGEPAPDHDLQLLLDRGNYHWGPQAFGHAYRWLWLTGEVFLLVERTRRAYAGLPTNLWPIGGQRMRVVPGTDGQIVARYLLTVPGESESNAHQLDPRDVVAATFWNPADPLRGQSPLSALRLGLDSEAAAKAANRDIFRNGLMADAVLGVGDTMTPEQSEQFAQQVHAQRKGGAHKLIMAPFANFSLERLSITPADAQFLELDKLTTRDVAKAYRMPPMFLGDLTDATFSNYETAWRALWELAVLPAVNLLASALTVQLATQYGPEVEVRPDRDSLDAMREDVAQQADTVGKLVAAGWQTEAASRFVFGEEPLADVTFADPANIAPTPEPAVAPSAGVLPPRREAPPTRRPIARSAGPLAVKAIPRDWRDRGQQVLAGLDAEVERAKPVVDAALQEWAEAASKALRDIYGAKSDEPQQAVSMAEELMRAMGAVPMQTLLSPMWESAAMQGVTVTANVWTLPVQPEMVRPSVLEWIQRESSQQVAWVTDTTRLQLRAAIGTAIDNGEGLAGVRQRVMAAFGRSDEPDQQFAYLDRVDNIALTETHRAYMHGSLEGMRDGGVEYHRWQFSMLPGSRHGDVSGQVRRVGEPFNVHGYRALYPGAATLPPGEACRCKCWTMPVDGPQDEERPEPEPEEQELPL
jgi:HK97 family phage portal protein